MFLQPPPTPPTTRYSRWPQQSASILLLASLAPRPCGPTPSIQTNQCLVGSFFSFCVQRPCVDSIKRWIQAERRGGGELLLLFCPLNSFPYYGPFLLSVPCISMNKIICTNHASFLSGDLQQMCFNLKMDWGVRISKFGLAIHPEYTRVQMDTSLYYSTDPDAERHFRAFPLSD